MVMHGPGVKTRPAIDRGDDDLGRTEQHGVDRVEIAVEALENLGERGAEIARGATWERLGQGLRVGGRTGDEELRTAAVDDRVVGAAHRGDEIGMWRVRGAAPIPLTTRSSGNFSSCALCNATSNTRATTCAPPARLCVGA